MSTGFNLDAITADVGAAELPGGRTVQHPAPPVRSCEWCGWPLVTPWTDDTEYCSVSCKVTAEVKS